MSNSYSPAPPRWTVNDPTGMTGKNNGQLDNIATSLKTLSDTTIPQISAQLAEIWGELKNQRDSDAEFIQTVGKLSLIGVKNLKGFNDGGQRFLHPIGDEPRVAEVPCGTGCCGTGSFDLFRRVSHITFFLSGLACGLAITSLTRKDFKEPL